MKQSLMFGLALGMCTVMPGDAPAQVKTFESGEVLTAADLNATVTALQDSIDNLTDTVEALQAEVDALASGGGSGDPLDLVGKSYCVTSAESYFFYPNEDGLPLGVGNAGFSARVDFNAGGTASVAIKQDSTYLGFEERSGLEADVEGSGSTTVSWSLSGNILSAFGQSAVVSESGDVILGGRSISESFNNGNNYLTNIVIMVRVPAGTSCP